VLCRAGLGCGLCCAVQCSAVLCCAMLCCAVLCCAAVLCCHVLSRAVLCCAVVCCPVSSSAAMCCAVMCCAVPSCAVLDGVTMRCGLCAGLGCAALSLSFSPCSSHLPAPRCRSRPFRYSPSGRSQPPLWPFKGLYKVTWAI